MNDHKLEQILWEIGQEKYQPSPALLARTRQRLRQNRWLPVLIALGIGLQILTLGGAQFFLLWSGASPSLQIACQTGLVAGAGCVMVFILAARKQVVSILYRLEAAAGCL